MATCVDGHEVPDEYRFCVHCGKPMPRTCPNGHEVPDGFAFCGHCGDPVADGAPAKKTAAKKTVAEKTAATPGTKEADAGSPDVAPDAPEAKPPPPAGWYWRPDDPTLDRWWDGAEWTEATRPRVGAPAAGGLGAAIAGAGRPAGPAPDREKLRDELVAYLKDDPPAEFAFKAAFSQGPVDGHLKPVGLVALFPAYLLTLTIEPPGSTGQVFGRRMISAFKPSGGVHSVIEGLADPVNGLLTVAKKVLGDRVDEDVLWTALNNEATAIVPCNEIRRVTVKRKYMVPRFWVEHDQGLLVIAQQSDEEMRHGLDFGPALRQFSGAPWQPGLHARLEAHAATNNAAGPP